MELRSVYERNERVVSRKIVDELILVPIRQNVADMETLYTLNEVGARVYELIDGRRSVAEIVQNIVAEFMEQLLEMDGVREVSTP